MSRPEHSAPPEIFYNEAEAEKYTNNTRMMNIQVILKDGQLCNYPQKVSQGNFHKPSVYYSCLPPHQAEMTERALELLCLPDEPCYVLDLGCGSGLSGECIEEQVTFTLLYVGYPLKFSSVISCSSRVTVGWVWTSPLLCSVSPMRGSWKGT